MHLFLVSAFCHAVALFLSAWALVNTQQRGVRHFWQPSRSSLRKISSKLGLGMAGLMGLIACSPAVPEGITYDLEAFMADSCQIERGRLGILQLEGKEMGGLEDELLNSCEDAIAEGDILTVAFFHPKRQDRVSGLESINRQLGFPVCAGCIQLPQVGSVEVVGLNLLEAKEKLQSLCQEQMHEMQVFIGYQKRQERKVEIVGAVREHLIDVDGKMRLYEVLSKARLYSHANLFKSYVLRNDQLLPVDLYKLLHQGEMSQNIVMRGGDRIFIATSQAATITVMGEVGKAQVIDLPYGFISLKEAIVSAKGIPFTGDDQCIQVIRGDLLKPKIYVLSWSCIRHVPNDHLLLMPGDTVYVSEKPLTQWNRFISQLQPSMSGAQTSYGTYQFFYADP